MKLIEALKAVVDGSELRIRQHIWDAETQRHPALDPLNMLCNRLVALRWRLSEPQLTTIGTGPTRRLQQPAVPARGSRNLLELDRYVVEDILEVFDVLPELEQWQQDFSLVYDLLNVQGTCEATLRDRYVRRLVEFELPVIVRSCSVLAHMESVVWADCAYERDGACLMLRPVLRVEMKGVCRLVKTELLVEPFPDTVRGFLAAGKAVLDTLTEQAKLRVLTPGFLPEAAELRKAERDAVFHGSCAILKKLAPADQARLRELLASKPNRDIFMVAAQKILG